MNILLMRIRSLSLHNHDTEIAMQLDGFPRFFIDNLYWVGVIYIFRFEFIM